MPGHFCDCRRSWTTSIDVRAYDAMPPARWGAWKGSNESSAMSTWPGSGLLLLLKHDVALLARAEHLGLVGSKSFRQ